MLIYASDQLGHDRIDTAPHDGSPEAQGLTPPSPGHSPAPTYNLQDNIKNQVRIMSVA